MLSVACPLDNLSVFPKHCWSGQHKFGRVAAQYVPFWQLETYACMRLTGATQQSHAVTSCEKCEHGFAGRSGGSLRGRYRTGKLVLSSHFQRSTPSELQHVLNSIGRYGWTHANSQLEAG